MKKKVVQMVAVGLLGVSLISGSCLSKPTDVKAQTNSEVQSAAEELSVQAVSDEYLFGYAEYTSTAIVPGMKKYDIYVKQMPVDAAYCKISTIAGRTSAQQLLLSRQQSFSYYLPDNESMLQAFMNDQIQIQFYDAGDHFLYEADFLIFGENGSYALASPEGTVLAPETPVGVFSNGAD